MRHKAMEEGGQGLVEFALVLPLLLLIIWGIVDFGKAFGYKNNETDISNQATRYASTNSCGSCDSHSPPIATIEQYMNDFAAVGELQGNLTITFGFPDTNGRYPWETNPADFTPIYDAALKAPLNHCAGTGTVKVKVEYTFDYVTKIFHTSIIRAFSVKRLERSWGNPGGQFRPGVDRYHADGASNDACPA